METLLKEIRFGFRMLRKSPGFTLAAVISLALAGVALGACFAPARRAIRVDPLIALKHE